MESVMLMLSQKLRLMLSMDMVLGTALILWDMAMDILATLLLAMVMDMVLAMALMEGLGGHCVIGDGALGCVVFPVVVSSIATMTIPRVSLGTAQGKRKNTEENYKLLHTGIKMLLPYKTNA